MGPPRKPQPSSSSSNHPPQRHHPAFALPYFPFPSAALLSLLLLGTAPSPQPLLPLQPPPAPQETSALLLRSLCRGPVPAAARVIGQGASGIAYAVEENQDQDPPLVVKVGKGPAALQALANEAKLLRRLADRGVTDGVEHVVGLETCPGQKDQTTVLALTPYWPNAEQIDRADGPAQVRALVRLLLKDVAVRGGVVLTDVQVLSEGGDLLLIDLTEGRALELDGDGRDMDGENKAALQAYMSEVVTLIAPSVVNHRAALQEVNGMGFVEEVMAGLLPLARGDGSEGWEY